MEIETAPDGNVMIAGGFSSSSFDFGGAPLVNGSDPGDNDLFIAKLPGNDGFGEVWSKRYGVQGSERAHSLAIDKNGDLIVTGSVSGAANSVGEDTIDSQSSDGFVAKYDGSSGSYIWSKIFQGAEHDFAVGIAVDDLGNPIIIGSTQSEFINFGGRPVPNPGAPALDVFIAKYSGTDGSHLFSAGFGSGFDDVGVAVTVDQVTRNVIAVGSFQSVMSPGSAQIESAGSNDGFIVSFGNIP